MGLSGNRISCPTQACSLVLGPVILYMGELDLFAMYVCTKSVQTHSAKGSRGRNRLLLP